MKDYYPFWGDFSLELTTSGVGRGCNTFKRIGRGTTCRRAKGKGKESNSAADKLPKEHPSSGKAQEGIAVSCLHRLPEEEWRASLRERGKTLMEARQGWLTCDQQTEGENGATKEAGKLGQFEI
jgi:hypothetical protein